MSLQTDYVEALKVELEGAKASGSKRVPDIEAELERAEGVAKAEAAAGVNARKAAIEGELADIETADEPEETEKAATTGRRGRKAS